jgi:hypothetical protein
LKVTPLLDDPPRWTDTARGDRPEGRAGDRLRAAKAIDPRELSVTYAREQVRWSRARWTRRSLAWAAAWVLFGMTLTAGAVTTGWWPQWRKPASLRGPDDVLEVPAGSTLRVGRRGRWRGTLVGPGEASVAAGDADVIRVSAGTFVLTAEAAPVVVWAGARQVRVAAGTSARVDMGEERAARVQMLGAQVSGEAKAAPAAPPPPVAPAVEAPPQATAPAGSAASSLPAPRPTRARVVQPAEDPPPTAVEAPAVPAPIAEPSAFVPALRPSAPDADPVAEAATETAALEAAVTALRRHADPRGALRLLAAAEARFPRADLKTEWATLRAEALLELGDKPQALRVLDLLPAGAPAFNRRLHVARGELRADQNRCAEAIADFQSVLAAVPHDDEDERALRGRAVCLLAGGGLNAARADLDLYVRVFPRHAFARQARVLLAKSDGAL